MVLAASYKFDMLCFHFHSSQSLISPAIYSLTHWLLWNVLFNLRIFLNFPYFHLLLISFWSVNVFHMISILFSLLRLVLWPSIWYILENILYTLQKNVYFIVGWRLQISVRSIIFSSYSSPLFPWFFCLIISSIIESEILKSPTIIAELFVSSLNFVCFCFIYFWSLLLNAYVSLILLYIPDELTILSL